MKKFAVVVCLLLGACGPHPDENICEPGETRSCQCPGVTRGAQACEGDGQGWDSCECPEQPAKSPYGTQVLGCGCWGYVGVNQTFPSVNCEAGRSIAQPCGGFCSAGGSPWGKFCL